MKRIVSLFLFVGLAACGSGDGTILPQGGTACSNDGQKQFVLDAMNTWYLWNDLLPASVDINDHATPEALLAFLSSFQTLDNFSFINSAEADAQFFGEGKFEGFGFSSRFLAADDLRLTRVFSGSPAANAGLARGQRILSLDGRTIAAIQASEGVGTVYNNPTVVFELRNIDGTEFTVSVTQDIVTIDPIPQWRIIDAGNGRNVGYLELATFISTADPVFDTVFAAFQAANVNDVIIDLRYNGGGLVSTAELLGDYLGGLTAENLLFSETQFNADRAEANNRREFFDQLLHSVSLTNLVVIATQGTASASELVTNSMIPHANVAIVGDRTFGKPVGQIGLAFCDNILRPTAFQTVNADGIGDYFDGLPVDCPVLEDLNVAVGDDLDPNMIVALTRLETNACPLASPLQRLASSAETERLQRDRRGPPKRVYLNAD